VTADVLMARMTDSRLTAQQRQDAARAYGQLVAADAACDAYGTRVLPVRGGVR
jgi:hypothetical protein